MNDWLGLRIAALIVVWSTVVVGVVMAAIWLKAGGGRAVGPEEELLAEGGVAVRTRKRETTSFSVAQVGMHGVLALLTAGLATYALLRPDDRGGGYLAVLGAVLVTGVPGALMYWRWRTGARPRVGGSGSADSRRVEDHLPSGVVALHGLLVCGIVVLFVGLLAVD